MKIAVDIDGTLSKTFEKYGELARKNGYDTSGGPADSFEYWETDMLYPNVPIEDMMRLYEAKWEEMRSSYELYPAADIILHLLDYDLSAVTNRRVFEDQDVCSVTASWLKEHDIPISTVHHVSDKASVCSELGFSVLIEDSPKNALPVAQAGTHVLLFDKVYNRHVPEHPNITRFSHWIEVPALLRRILK